ncbi:MULTISPECIES: hypothetical protein [Flavobacterium]|uniref:Uncharacterized protein n=1 Tax=Flavobacterium ranwuense TaxID=2541725 RepID=A0ABY2DQB5_9FLAO|nr:MULTISPECIES: hypothetical protein [Flavobacterium]TDE28727.1 hypothetical protein E0I61_10045 [Flavobacterium ranwuense]TDE53082.1 hypothetical protein E0H99_10415 [Flavobacterium sp. GT3P67]
MAKPVVITLTVQTANLYGMNIPSQTQVDGCCALSDDNSGSSPNGTLEDFQSNVFINNNVRWVGVSNDSGYSVAIDSIVYEPESNDVNFFDNATINGTGGRSGNASANVKNDPNLVNQSDIYTINFSVYNSGNSYKAFSIDPKLAINP